MTGITARSITSAMRGLHPAPVRLSVRADRADPGRFYLRLPRAAEQGAPPFDRRWPWLEQYLGRRLGAAVTVERERYIRRRDYGKDVEFSVQIGGPR